MYQKECISSRVAEVNLAIKDLRYDDTSSCSEARTKALEASKKLTAALMTPEEVVVHHAFEVCSY